MKRYLVLAVLVLGAGLALCSPSFAGAPVVQIETNMGNIVVRLEERKAPITCENFLQYVKSGFYDGTIFHRVIKGFMIQGGGFTPEMKEKPTHAPIKNEASIQLRNRKYTIAMARTSAPDSATSQFFINTANNRFLDPDKASDGVGYAVFGTVIQGEGVVDRIEKVETSNRHPFYKDMPVEPVVIKSMKVLGE